MLYWKVGRIPTWPPWYGDWCVLSMSYICRVFQWMFLSQTGWDNTLCICIMIVCDYVSAICWWVRAQQKRSYSVYVVMWAASTHTSTCLSCIFSGWYLHFSSGSSCWAWTHWYSEEAAQCRGQHQLPGQGEKQILLSKSVLHAEILKGIHEFLQGQWYSALACHLGGL